MTTKSDKPFAGRNFANRGTQMPPANAPTPPPARTPATIPAMIGAGPLSPAQKDSMIEWYRGEFAAANAIIDALCHHLAQISGSPAEYGGAFAAIHRRRMNWIPVIQMQKYFTIAEVARELWKADVEGKRRRGEKMAEEEGGDVSKCHGNGGGCGSSEGEDSPDSEITDTGSHEVQVPVDHIEICDSHEDCSARREQIKMTKGFVAKELVKGHMVNVVKGLKMYEDIFTDSEISKLKDFVAELRTAGQNGQLLGETYILFNKQTKENKREQIQLGVPVFEAIKNEAMSLGQKPNIEELPALLQSVIDHLVEWHILPESRKPNGCIINYFDEGEYCQPYLKPPHLDQPMCTLVLSKSTMAFGRMLVNDGDGNIKGNLMLCLKQGSLLVMRNNSADRAKHAMCSSPTRRVTITFLRVRSMNNCQNSPSPPLLAQPPPLLWLHPSARFPSTPHRAVMNPTRMTSSYDHPNNAAGTGVFLPWGVGSKKHTPKNLPPRCLKEQRFPALLHNTELSCSDTMSDENVESS